MERPSVHYETSDANVPSIAGWGVGLAAILVAVLFVAAGLFSLFSGKRVSSAAYEQVKLPRDLSQIPGPLLQTDETADLEKQRRAEDQRLHSYGWVDANRVHIPIEEAMRCLSDPECAARHGVRSVPRKEGQR